MRKVVALLLYAFTVGSAAAQISEPIMPRYREQTMENASVAGRIAENVYVLPEVNNQLEIENAKRIKEKTCKDCRKDYYGKGIDASINVKKTGRKIELNDGNIWILKVSSKSATGFQFYFSEYNLPPGATLHIYSAKSNLQQGAFTEKNNHKDKRFVTAIFPEGEAVIEYFEPNNAPFKGQLKIDKVIHVFKLFSKGVERDTGDPGYNASGSCTVNINCNSGTEVDVESRAVTMLSHYDDRTGMAAFCTGFLINSTNDNSNKKPFVMTAGHCITDLVPGYYYDFILYFKYENPTCESTSANPLVFAKSFQGAYLRSANRDDYNDNNSDYALFEMFDKPERYTSVAYLGWDRRKTSQAGTVYNISHPYGDAMKLAKGSNPVSIQEVKYGNCVNYTLEAWQVSWTLGVTQPGSSGSPILNNAKLVIGVLHGGISRCSDSPVDAECGLSSSISGPDFFSRMDYNWDHPSGPPNTYTLPPLAVFLDETATLKTTLATYVPPAPPTGGGGTPSCKRLDGDSQGIKISLAPIKEVHFGATSAIYGNDIIVGAFGDSKIYIYKIENCEVKLKGELSGDVGEINFARSVDIFGDYIAVGQNAYPASGGSVYLYKRSGDSWTRVAKFNSLESGKTGFGSSVSLSNDYLVVGSPHEGSDFGMVYVYKKDANGNWSTPFRYPSQFQAGDEFGASVDIYNDRIAIGAPGLNKAGGIAILRLKNLGGTMVFDYETSFDYSGPIGCDIGRDVEIFGNEILATVGICGGIKSLRFNGTQWSDHGDVSSPEATQWYYGISAVAFNNNYALIGDWGNTGLVHVFTKGANGEWVFLRALYPDERKSGDDYSASIGLTDKHILVGNAEGGINTPGACTPSGSVYVYDLNSVVNTDINVCTASYLGTRNMAARAAVFGGTPSCSVVFQNTSKSTYTANSITLLPGFSAQSGSEFKAISVGCPNFNNGYLNSSRIAEVDVGEEYEFSPGVAVEEEYELSAVANYIEESDKDLTVYPNPSSNGLFTIKSYSGEIQRIELFDLQGKLISDANFRQETQKIVQVELSSDKVGIIVIKATIDNKIFLKKMSVH